MYRVKAYLNHLFIYHVTHESFAVKKENLNVEVDGYRKLVTTTNGFKSTLEMIRRLQAFLPRATFWNFPGWRVTH